MHVGTFSVKLTLAVPAGTPVPPVPTSHLFDPLAPHTQTGSLTFNIAQDNTLDVRVTVASDADAAGPGGANSSPDEGAPSAEPGANVTLQLQVNQANGTAAAGAEVTLIAVDQAMLDLMPYPLQDVADAMWPQLPAELSVQGMNELRASQVAIDAVFDTILRRLKIDPWVPADTQASHAILAPPYIFDMLKHLQNCNIPTDVEAFWVLTF